LNFLQNRLDSCAGGTHIGKFIVSRIGA